MNPDLRWLQRFQNYERALALLGEPLLRGIDTLSALEKEGTVQRFEYTLELAWKTLKDYLENEGQVLQPLTPRSVMKEAFASSIVSDGQVWIDMIDHRILLSHKYDQATFDQAVRAIHDRYFPAMEELRFWLSTRRPA